jgi:Fasciclin domain
MCAYGPVTGLLGVLSCKKFVHFILTICHAEYLNDPNLAITFFAPTNAAWEKRISTLTKMNDISVYDLFSEGRSPALAELLKYHILQGNKAVSSLASGSRFAEH